MCRQGFCANTKGPHVEALRRVYTALIQNKPYGRTEEFEALCQFEDMEGT